MTMLSNCLAITFNYASIVSLCVASIVTAMCHCVLNRDRQLFSCLVQYANINGGSLQFIS